MTAAGDRTPNAYVSKRGTILAWRHHDACCTRTKHEIGQVDRPCREGRKVCARARRKIGAQVEGTLLPALPAPQGRPSPPHTPVKGERNSCPRTTWNRLWAPGLSGRHGLCRGLEVTRTPRIRGGIHIQEDLASAIGFSSRLAPASAVGMPTETLPSAFSACSGVTCNCPGVATRCHEDDPNPIAEVLSGRRPNSRLTTLSRSRPSAAHVYDPQRTDSPGSCSSEWGCGLDEGQWLKSALAR